MSGKLLTNVTLIERGYPIGSCVCNVQELWGEQSHSDANAPIYEGLISECPEPVGIATNFKTVKGSLVADLSFSGTLEDNPKLAYKPNVEGAVSAKVIMRKIEGNDPREVVGLSVDYVIIDMDLIASRPKKKPPVSKPKPKTKASA